MYRDPPPELSRALTWRSILVGYAMMVGVVVLMVAVSYPRTTVVVIAAAAVLHVLYRVKKTVTAAGRLPISQAAIRVERWYRPK